MNNYTLTPLLCQALIAGATKQIAREVSRPAREVTSEIYVMSLRATIWGYEYELSRLQGKPCQFTPSFAALYLTDN